jgi:cytochrome c peroxidase
MLLATLSGMGNDSPTAASLGGKLYFDTSLSNPPGQACASCHLPGAGFADPDRELPVSRGVHPERFGSRNAPTLSYAMYSPPFHYDKEEELYVGGQFLDGRVATLEEQARKPFTNPVEMANADEAAVIERVRNAPYAAEFDAVYKLEGGDFNMDHVVNAIATFQRSQVFRPFTSKYDYYLAGKVALTEQEKRGLELFNDEKKGNCAACHPSTVGEDGTPPLFTDYTYDNLGAPFNANSPFYSQDMQFNPEGEKAIDIGLGKTTGRPEDNGKFKVSTLRNIALTPPYMHNGVFATLREVVDFYNTRDTDKKWAPAEVQENINVEELGDLKLTDAEVDDIVVFMETLTDGYDVREGKN